jgi:hypothetical protein
MPGVQDVITEVAPIASEIVAGHPLAALHAALAVLKKKPDEIGDRDSGRVRTERTGFYLSLYLDPESIGGALGPEQPSSALPLASTKSTNQPVRRSPFGVVQLRCESLPSAPLLLRRIPIYSDISDMGVVVKSIPDYSRWNRGDERRWRVLANWW